MAGGGHRSTLKQSNKAHNHGKHRSKRNLKREARGKTNVKALTKSNKVKDILRQETGKSQTNNREDLVDQKRTASSLPPRLVTIVSLDKTIDTQVVLDLLKDADLSAEVKTSEQSVVHVSAGKLKKRLCFLVPEYGNLQALLDATKVADVLLFLLSGDKAADRYGEHCLACITGQGMPAHVFACQGLSNLSKKKTADAKRKIDKFVQKSFPGDKFRSIDTWQDAQAIWRQMANMAEKPVHYRDARPYLLAEKVEFSTNPENGVTDQPRTEAGTLKLSGYLRGQSLNVNQLVHLPGWGDFQLAQVDQWRDPYPLVIKGNKDRRQKVQQGSGDAEMEEETETAMCLAKATNPESLQSEIVPDEMDQEQTWPTAEELAEAEPAKVKRLKGVSDYQSNWILDLVDGAASGDDEDDDDDEDMEEEEMGEGEKEDGEEDNEDEDDDDDLETATGTETETDNYDEHMDMEEEKKMYERMKEERLHVHFPDEVDTPLETDARNRFARYRGMDSFQTTVWDPNESLPFDYGRIYRVSKHHYKRLKKISMQEREDDGDNLPAEHGNYITVHVKNVPKAFMDSYSPGLPVTLFGLFSNEQKMTLVSAQVMRMSNFKAPVKSKDPLVFQVGFRRFSTCPVFSEHAFQSKFKMERFLPANGFIVASMYAPIMFAPAPVLVFRENVMEKYDLVAKGSLLPLDTNRIVIKRVVLSGAPFKINKKSVVVRYMFFNREDIDYYKPIELRTKWGKRGHIKQAMGTHGHMKCKFNGQLKSEDTVLMNLYKRVFPKWNFDIQVAILPPAIMDEEHKEDEDDDEDEMRVEEEEKRGEAFKMFD